MLLPVHRGGHVVTIGMNYFVRAGKEKIFEDACARVVEVMQETSGHDRSEVYRKIGEGSPIYLVVSRWTSEDAFRAFVASDAFKKVTNWGALNILDGPPRHTTYREG
jgi:heme-degrading monooxygenase HmoA